MVFVKAADVTLRSRQRSQELETHAREELQHALIVSKQIDYLGGMPTVVPLPVKASEDAEHQEQEHQIDLATALGEAAPTITSR